MDMVMLIMSMFMVVVVVVRMLVVVMIMMIMVMMSRIIMKPGIGVVMFGVVRMIGFAVSVFGGRVFRVVVALMRLSGLRGIEAGVLDDLALDALAMAAAARVAVARATAVGPVLGFLFGFAVGALVRLDQCLPVGDRNLIIIGVDFAEGQEAVAVAAIFDEGRLQ
jgi:hypothetical protein